MVPGGNISRRSGAWGINLKPEDTEIFRFRKGKIGRQMALSMVGVTFGVLLIIFVMNTTLLPYVYYYEKQRTMEDAFATLNQATAAEDLSMESFRATFENLCAKNNLSMLVIRADGSVLLSSRGDFESIYMAEQLIRIILNGDTAEQRGAIINENDSYTLERVHDERLKDDFLVLWGTLADGNMIMIRCAVESITGSIVVVNRFILIVAVVSLALSILVARYLSGRITKPILKLADISNRMSRLDFREKYVYREKGNEVDVLGQHFNTMSETLEETIRELRQANIELRADIENREKNEEMRREFLSNVSHELKTPIALIQGYAEGLSEGITEDPEETKYYADVIVDEARKMNRMVQELLSLNQLEYGKSTVSMEHFDLAAVIDGMVEQMKVMADKYGAHITFEGTGPLMVWADEFFTEQVISNYLSNAIHYAKNEKRVKVTAEEQEGKVRVTVFNTGDPISEENLPHIWEKFYKADKARTRSYGGSGIGLSVVKAVTEAFGTGCGVENREKGVAFWFELDR